MKNTTKYASPGGILAAAKFFEANPQGTITTGFWADPTFTKDEFYAWFQKCLFAKCGGGPYTERQANKIHDGRIINDYIGKRIRRYGSGILNDPAMQRRYPHINKQVFSEY